MDEVHYLYACTFIHHTGDFYLVGTGCLLFLVSAQPTTDRASNVVRMSTAEMVCSPLVFQTLLWRCIFSLGFVLSSLAVHLLESHNGVLWAACTVWVFVFRGLAQARRFWMGPDSCLLLPQGVINSEGGIVRRQRRGLYWGHTVTLHSCRVRSGIK